MKKGTKVIWILICVFALGIGQAVLATPAGHYNWGGATGLYNMDFFYTIESDSGPGTYVFWAHQFWFEGGDGGYTGLQTNGTIRRKSVGNMAIFSIWQAEKAKAAQGATAQKFGGEGTGYSVRIPYPYVQGVKYRFRIASEGDSWWGVTIEDTSTGVETYMGSIKVPATWGSLQGYSANFTEVFGGAATCFDQPYAKARFDLPQANDGTLNAILSSSETYGDCGGGTGSTAYTDRAYTDRAYPDGTALIHEIGVQ